MALQVQCPALDRSIKQRRTGGVTYGKPRHNPIDQRGVLGLETPLVRHQLRPDRELQLITQLRRESAEAEAPLTNAKRAGAQQPDVAGPESLLQTIVVESFGSR